MADPKARAAYLFLSRASGEGQLCEPTAGGGVSRPPGRETKHKQGSSQLHYLRNLAGCR